MTDMEWKNRFEAELLQAEGARAAGNEGKARVCARRAAGIAIAAHFSRRGSTLPGASAYNHLRYLSEYSPLPEEVRQVALHFLVRTNPDHSLPIEVDLIEEARWLADKLSEELS